MRLLLDTHILIWALLDHPMLSRSARALLGDPDNTIWISSISFFEVSIKRSLGRSGLQCSTAEVKQYVEQSHLGVLGLSARHACTLEELPWLHRDPFDRILVAQALTEPMRLVTHDDWVTQYSDSIIKV